MTTISRDFIVKNGLQANTASTFSNTLSVGGVLTATVGVNTAQVNVGSNVVLTNTSLTVGNSSVNTVTSATQIRTGNSTVNSSVSASEFRVSNSTGNTVITPRNVFTPTANIGDLVVSGNLTVTGTTTTINTTDLNIGDNQIVLNADLPGGSAPSENAGIIINRGSSANVSLLWDEASDSWTTSSNTVISGTLNVTTQIDVGSVDITNTSISVGLTSTNTTITNTTVNTPVVSATNVSATNVSTAGITASGLANVAALNTGTANASVALNVGADVTANTTTIKVGVSTVNSSVANVTTYRAGVISASSNGFAANATTISLGNTTVNVAMTPTSVAIGSSTIGNTLGLYTTGVVNATSYMSGAIGTGTGGTVQNTTVMFVGNNTINTSITAGSITVNGTAVVANSLGISVGTVFSANTTRVRIANTIGLEANGSLGSVGQVLTSNGTTVYWNDNVTYDLLAIANTEANKGVIQLDPSVGANDNVSFIGLNGIIVSSNSLGVYIDGDEYIRDITAGSGLTGGGASGNVSVAVGQGNGISVSADAIAVAPGVDGGLLANTSGLWIVAGSGLVTNTSGLGVGTGNGISVSSDAIAVNGANGISVDTAGVNVLAGTGSGLSVNSTGVWVVSNTGLVANATGLHVNSSYIGTLSVNNATYLNGQLASYYTNATNINAGTLDNARLPAAIAVTSVNASALTVGSSIIANTSRLAIGTSIGVQANGSIGTNGQVLTSNGTTVYWKTSETVLKGGGTDLVFFENDTSIASDYTISTGKNAGTFGPVTINNGITVTIPDNSTWTIA